MKTYKVRVTNLPMDNIDQMAYGGQSSYALDVGNKKVHTDLSRSPYDFENNTLGPIDREDANIEAEKDETAVGDFSGDGILRHYKIGGKRHSEGGTPLNVPEGTFIFSDTRKMKIKDPELLSYFNMPNKKGGYTPAEIANRQYGNLNKFTAFLEDPTKKDDLGKKTAATMRNNYLKKLGMLAFHQESLKQFPQGVPDIARPYLPDEVIQSIEGGGEEQQMEQGEMTPDMMDPNQQMLLAMYGMNMATGGELPFGLEKYQFKGQVGMTPRRVQQSEIPGLEAKGYKKRPDSNTWEYKVLQQRDKTLGQPGSTSAGTPGSVDPGYQIKGGRKSGSQSGPCANLKYTIEDMNARPGCYNTFLNKQGFKDASDEEKRKGLYKMLHGEMPTYTKAKPGETKPGTPDTCPDGFKWNDVTQKCERMDYDLVDINNTTTTTTMPPPGKRPPGSFNFLDYATIPPKIYFPDYAQIEANIPEPTFYDPTRELAEQASTRNTMAQYASQLDPQAFSARANALQAQGAEQAANTMGRYQNLNVGVANQFAPMQSQIANTLSQLRADRYDKLMTGNAVAKQQYDNAMRDYIDRFQTVKRFKDRENMMMNMVNQSNPYFMADQRGNLILRPEAGRTGVDYITSGAGAAGSTAGGAGSFQDYQDEIKRLRADGYDAATIKMIMERNPKFASVKPAMARGGVMPNYLNSYMAALSQSAYPFGGRI